MENIRKTILKERRDRAQDVFDNLEDKETNLASECKAVVQTLEGVLKLIPDKCLEDIIKRDIELYRGRCKPEIIDTLERVLKYIDQGYN
jgi:hypothetical protein